MNAQDDIPTVGIEVWTPAMFREQLERPPSGQRKVNVANVSVYRRLEALGRWYPETGTPICIMKDGRMGNGYHRCTAFASLPDDHDPIRVLVARGCPDESLRYMDTGANRTLAHHLGYAIPTSGNLRAMASIASIVMAYDGPPRLPRVDVKPDPADAVEHVVRNLDRYEAAARIAKGVAKADGDWSGAVVTERTLGWLLFYTLDHRDAEEFWVRHGKRRHDGHDDPRALLVRHYSKGDNRLPRGAMSRQVTMERLANLAATWDAHLHGTLWKPWDGTVEGFRHPQPPHPERAVA